MLWLIVCGPYVVSLLTWTPILLKCILAWFVVKNGHQKTMYYNQIGLFAQKVDIILGSTVGFMYSFERIFASTSYNFCILTLNICC